MLVYRINISYLSKYCYLSHTKKHFSFCLVELRHHKMIRTYRSNFKTLEFSSKKTTFYIFLLSNKVDKNLKKEKFCIWQQPMENKSYKYEVMYIHNAFQQWKLSGMYSFLNESGLLRLMSDKKCVVWAGGF